MVGSLRRVTINTSILTIGQLLGRVTGLIFVPFVARQLGSADLAGYQLSNLLIAYLSILVLFGLSPLIVRGMAQNPKQISKLFGESLSLRLVFSFVSLAALGVLLWLSDYPKIVNQMTIILSVGLFTTALTDAADTVFQANEKMAYSVTITLSGTLIYLLLGWAALMNGFGIFGLAIANAVMMVLRAIITYFVLRARFFLPRLHWHWESQKSLLREAVPFFIGGASAYVLSKIDVFILSRMVPLAVVGLYVAGYFFLDIAQYIPSAFSQAIYPELSRTASQTMELLQQKTQRYYKMIFAAGLIIIATVVPLAPWLIHLIYGAKFEASVPVLQIVIWSVILVAYNGTVGRAIYAAGGQWQLVIVAFTGAVSNIILNLILIPYYGIMGSSIATVGSFALCSLLHGYYARHYKCSVEFGIFFRTIPVLIIGLTAGWFFTRYYPPMTIVCVPVIIVSGLIISKYFTSEELSGLSDSKILPGVFQSWLQALAQKKR